MLAAGSRYGEFDLSAVGVPQRSMGFGATDLTSTTAPGAARWLLPSGRFPLLSNGGAGSPAEAYRPKGGRARTALRVTVGSMTKLRFIWLLLAAAMLAASLAVHHPIGMSDGGYW